MWRIERLLAFFVLAGLTGTPHAAPLTATPGVLRVAVYENFPPYSDAGQGLDVELGEALAARLGLRADIVSFRAGEEMGDDLRNMVWKGHYLGTRAADVLMHVPVDPAFERANDKVRIFGAYQRESLALARDPARLGRIEGRTRQGLEALGEARIGVEFDSVADAHLMQALGGALRSQVAHFRSVALAAEALKRGEVAAVLATRGELEGALRYDTRFVIDYYRMPPPAKEGWPVGMAVKAEASSLATAIEMALDGLRRDGSLGRIFARYGLSLPAEPAALAWVPNEKSGSITVIDTGTNDVVTQFAVGGRPRGIAVDRSGGKLFVSDAATNRLRVFAARTGQTLGDAATGASPEDLQLSPDGALLAVAVEETHSVSLFDATTLALVADIRVDGKNPEHLAFSPDGRWLLATAEEAEQVDVIDLQAKKQTDRITVGKRPRGVAFSPDGHRVFVACELASTLYVIDFDARQVVATLAAGSFSNGVAITPDGSMVFVSNGKAASVTAFDAHRLERKADIAVGERPWNMALTPDGKRLYVASGRANRVNVIDTETLDAVKAIEVGLLPWGVAIR